MIHRYCSPRLLRAAPQHLCSTVSHSLLLRTHTHPAPSAIETTPQLRHLSAWGRAQSAQRRWCSGEANGEATSMEDDTPPRLLENDYVKVRDSTEAWRYGFVEEYEDGRPKVMVDGFRSAYHYDEVVKIDAMRAPDWVTVGDRVLCDGQRHTVQRVFRGHMWIVRDAFFAKPELCMHEVEKIEETVFEQLYYLLLRPSQMVLLIRQEGVFCLLIYLALRLPLALCAAVLAMCHEGYITGYDRHQVISGFGVLYAVSQVLRPVCGVAALLLAKRLRISSRLFRKAK